MRARNSSLGRDDYTPDKVREDNLPFRLGELVMCRYSSYPYWPATIDQTHQSKLRGNFWSFRKTRRGQRILSFWCTFSNEDTGGWVRHDRMVHYHPDIVASARLDKGHEFFKDQKEALEVAHQAYMAQPRKKPLPKATPADYGEISAGDELDQLEEDDEDDEDADEDDDEQDNVPERPTKHKDTGATTTTTTTTGGRARGRGAAANNNNNNAIDSDNDDDEDDDDDDSRGHTNARSNNTTKQQQNRRTSASNSANVSPTSDERDSSDEQEESRRKQQQARVNRHPAKRARASASATPATAKKNTPKAKAQQQRREPPKRSLKRASTSASAPTSAARPRKRSKTSTPNATTPNATPQATPKPRDRGRARHNTDDDDKDHNNSNSNTPAPPSTTAGKTVVGSSGHRAPSPNAPAENGSRSNAGGKLDPTREISNATMVSKLRSELKDAHSTIDLLRKRIEARDREIKNLQLDNFVRFGTPASPTSVKVDLPPVEEHLKEDTTSEEFSEAMKSLDTTFRSFRAGVNKAETMRHGLEDVQQRLTMEYQKECAKVVDQENATVADEKEMIEILLRMLKMKVSVDDLRDHKAGNVVRAVGKACRQLESVNSVCTVIYDSWKVHVLSYLQKQGNTATDQTKQGSSNSSTPQSRSPRQEMDTDPAKDDDKDERSEGKDPDEKGSDDKVGKTDSPKEPMSDDQSPSHSKEIEESPEPSKERVEDDSKSKDGKDDDDKDDDDEKDSDDDDDKDDSDEDKDEMDISDDEKGDVNQKETGGKEKPKEVKEADDADKEDDKDDSDSSQMSDGESKDVGKSEQSASSNQGKKAEPTKSHGKSADKEETISEKSKNKGDD